MKIRIILIALSCILLALTYLNYSKENTTSNQVYNSTNFSINPDMEPISPGSIFESDEDTEGDDSSNLETEEE